MCVCIVLTAFLYLVINQLFGCWTLNHVFTSYIYFLSKQNFNSIVSVESRTLYLYGGYPRDRCARTVHKHRPVFPGFAPGQKHVLPTYSTRCTDIITDQRVVTENNLRTAMQTQMMPALCEIEPAVALNTPHTTESENPPINQMPEIDDEDEREITARLVSYFGKDTLIDRPSQHNNLLFAQHSEQSAVSNTMPSDANAQQLPMHRNSTSSSTVRPVNTTTITNESSSLDTQHYAYLKESSCLQNECSSGFLQHELKVDLENFIKQKHHNNEAISFDPAPGEYCRELPHTPEIRDHNAEHSMTQQSELFKKKREQRQHNRPNISVSRFKDTRLSIFPTGSLP